LAEIRPRALVFDIASLKGPLKEGLMAVATSSMNATSMHPMFGPNTQLLSGRHVILVDLGNKKANRDATELFSRTMATIVEMNAEDHDRNMAFLLGLSHAVNMVFSAVLAQSGESAPRLSELSSTTFDAQTSIAARVAMENPKLYYEIQASNPFGDLSLKMLESTVSELRTIVNAKDEQRFIAFMQAGYNYFKSMKKD
jgi:chorismate mutase/prephenate dehydrogenase